jgi:hypothetical protein
LTQSDKQICFAVLVHNNKDVVIDLLDNIKFYCPNSKVVLYNGGDDPELCKELEIPVCPTSRKLQYGVTAIYLLETMKWLEKINLEYDFLINLDSDALFVREGYEQFIYEQMKNKDYMGVDTKPLESNNFCGIQFKKEYNLWEPLFGTISLYESFNVGQVFSKRLVNSLLISGHFQILMENLNKTKAFGIDEIAYVTMVKMLGFDLHAYPKSTGNSIRYRPHFHLDETVSLLYKNQNAFLLHPIHRNMKDETRAFINSMLKQKFQFEKEKSKRLLQQDLGNLPIFLYGKKTNSVFKEWLACSPETGITYWNASNCSFPSSFKVDSFTALETQNGKIEALCRIGNKLYHLYLDEKNSGKWVKSKPFAFGVTGIPMFIESSFGSLEVVAPLKGGGLAHWWKDNKHPNRPWIGPKKFGKGYYQKGILVENNESQLTVVVEVKDGYRYFVEDNGKKWKWNGPFI